MPKKRAHIGSINEEGAICIDKKGPVELWSTPNGEYLVYCYIDEEVFLHNKRDFSEEAKRIFDATVRMVKRR